MVHPVLAYEKPKESDPKEAEELAPDIYGVVTTGSTVCSETLYFVDCESAD